MGRQVKRIVVHAVGCGVLWALCAPSVARATFMTGKFEKETYFNPGFLLGGVLRDGRVEGALGVEVSVHRFTAEGLGVGVFGQWQRLASSHRFCGGVQTTFAGKAQGVGAELGVAHETGDTRAAATTSVHVAPFISFGVATVSLRVGIPFHAQASSLPGRGFEGGLNLALKLPIFLDGVDDSRSQSNRSTRTAR